MTRRTYVTIDLGAESGRVIAGAFDGERFELDLVHRFNNGVLRRGDHLQWNSELLKREIIRGLEQIGGSDPEVCSVAV
jgi:rhamnulokinase